MLEQVRAAFPGADVFHTPGTDTFAVTIGDHSGYFFYRDGQWSGHWPSDGTLEGARDAWYKALKDEARKNLDDLRAALRVPPRPPQAFTWRGFTFEPDAHVFRCTTNEKFTVHLERHKPETWLANLQWYRGQGGSPPEALDSLHRSLCATRDHHAWTVEHNQRSLEEARKVLALLNAHG